MSGDLALQQDLQYRSEFDFSFVCIIPHVASYKSYRQLVVPSFTVLDADNSDNRGTAAAGAGHPESLQPSQTLGEVLSYLALSQYRCLCYLDQMPHVGTFANKLPPCHVLIYEGSLTMQQPSAGAVAPGATIQSPAVVVPATAKTKKRQVGSPVPCTRNCED